MSDSESGLDDGSEDDRFLDPFSQEHRLSSHADSEDEASSRVPRTDAATTAWNLQAEINEHRITLQTLGCDWKAQHGTSTAAKFILSQRRITGMRQRRLWPAHLWDSSFKGISLLPSPSSTPAPSPCPPLLLPAFSRANEQQTKALGLDSSVLFHFENDAPCDEELDAALAEEEQLDASENVFCPITESLPLFHSLKRLTTASYSQPVHEGILRSASRRCALLLACIYEDSSRLVRHARTLKKQSHFGNYQTILRAASKHIGAHGLTQDALLRAEARIKAILQANNTLSTSKESSDSDAAPPLRKPSKLLQYIRRKA